MCITIHIITVYGEFIVDNKAISLTTQFPTGAKIYDRDHVEATLLLYFTYR